MTRITGAYGNFEPTAPRPYTRGLFSFSNVVDTDDPHLMLGAEYATYRCNEGNAWLEMCDPAGSKILERPSLVRGDSFTVYDSIQCETVTGDAGDRARREFAESFETKSEAVVEARLKSILAANAVTPTADVTEALISMQDALASYAGLGMLHMNNKFATTALSKNLIVNGTDIREADIVVGRGYTSNDYWVAATGQITVLRDSVRVVEASPTREQQPILMAEQNFVLLIECISAWAEPANA